MSTDKSLKHLKSNDKLLITNVSNYFNNTQGGTAHHIQSRDHEFDPGLVLYFRED